jgi:hypothetical protein
MEKPYPKVVVGACCIRLGAWPGSVHRRQRDHGGAAWPQGRGTRRRVEYIYAIHTRIHYSLNHVKRSRGRQSHFWRRRLLPLVTLQKELRRVGGLHVPRGKREMWL